MLRGDLYLYGEPISWSLVLRIFIADPCCAVCCHVIDHRLEKRNHGYLAERVMVIFSIGGIPVGSPTFCLALALI